MSPFKILKRKKGKLFLQFHAWEVILMLIHVKMQYGQTQKEKIRLIVNLVLVWFILLHVHCQVYKFWLLAVKTFWKKRVSSAASGLGAANAAASSPLAVTRDLCTSNSSCKNKRITGASLVCGLSQEFAPCSIEKCAVLLDGSVCFVKVVPSLRTSSLVQFHWVKAWSCFPCADSIWWESSKELCSREKGCLNLHVWPQWAICRSKGRRSRTRIFAPFLHSILCMCVCWGGGGYAAEPQSLPHLFPPSRVGFTGWGGLAAMLDELFSFKLLICRDVYDNRQKRLIPLLALHSTHKWALWALREADSLTVRVLCGQSQRLQGRL